MKLFRRAALLAASLLVASAPMASADTFSSRDGESGGVTHPGADLTLFVTEPGHDFTYSTSLQCMPTGGDHSDAWGSCFALKEANGNFDKLTPLDGEVCTREYNPVVFSAVGHWKGERVYWSKGFANRCTGNVATGGIFDF